MGVRGRGKGADKSTEGWKVKELRPALGRAICVRTGLVLGRQ